jgi:hypothetical protein
VSRRQKLWIGAYAVLVLAAAGFALLRGEDTRQDVPETAERTTLQILYENCRTDRRFREAYRNRGIVERKLLRLEERANEALINVVNEIRLSPGPTLPSIRELGDRLDRLNAKLGDLRARVVIYPLPKCQEIRHDASAKPTTKGRRDDPTALPAEPRTGGERPGAPAPAAPDSGDGGGSGDTPGGGSPGGQPSPPSGENPPPGDGPGGPGGPSPGPAPSDPTIGDGVGKAVDGALEQNVPKVIEGAADTSDAAKAEVCARLEVCP